jgi:hypothetical protein
MEVFNIEVLIIHAKHAKASKITKKVAKGLL